jgi:hypothetical protein
MREHQRVVRAGRE